MKTVALLLVLAASLANVWVALRITDFRAFLHDTNGGVAFSRSGRLLIEHETFFVTVAIVIPALAVAATFLRHRNTALIGGSILFLMAVSEIFFTLYAVSETLISP